MAALASRSAIQLTMAAACSMVAAAADHINRLRGPEAGLEGQGRRSAGLTNPKDGVDDGRTIERAQEGVGPATLACHMRPYVACLDLLLYM